jgi:uncharacterized protein (DUF427 family)
MPHATAKLNGTVLADADSYEVVEGNIYFPPSSVKKEYLQPTNSHSKCPWKGEASYYTIDVGDGNELKDSAWYYPHPLEKATHIKDYVAFCLYLAILIGYLSANILTDKTKVDITTS